MKKFISLFLVLVLAFGCISGVTASAAKTKSALVGVALMSNDNNTSIIKDYLNNEIGPALDMQFDFSEAISSSEALVTFIENEYMKGAKGIINLYTSGAAAGISKCEELGIVIQNQKSALDADYVEFACNLGNCGASSAGMEVAYKAAMENILSDGEEHSVLLYSCAAAGRQAESHYYSSMAVFEAMQNAYGLTYEKSIEEMAQEDFVGERATGKDNIKIFQVSGFPGTEAVANGISNAISTGNYDIFVAVASYSMYASYIDAAEKSTGKNIRILATASIEDQTKTGFSTLDSTGSYVLDAAIINPLAVAYAINATAVRNAIDGKADLYKEEGKAVQLNVEPWVCLSAEQFEGISKLDNVGTWVISGEEAKALCDAYNPGVELSASRDLWQDLLILML